MQHYKIHVVHWFGTIFSALSDRALKRCCHKVSAHPSLTSLPCSYSLYLSICCFPPFEHRTTQAAVRLQSTALKPPPPPVMRPRPLFSPYLIYRSCFVLQLPVGQLSALAAFRKAAVKQARVTTFHVHIGAGRLGLGLVSTVND